MNEETSTQEKIQESIDKVEAELSANSASQLKLQPGSPRVFTMKQDYLKLMIKEAELNFEMSSMKGYSHA